jgi:hypothetical protein
MKTAIYIEDGVVQLVITPETVFEKGAMKTFEDQSITAKIFTGSFYDCRGGWVRQADFSAGGRQRYGDKNSDTSLIIKTVNVKNKSAKDEHPSAIWTGVGSRQEE